MWWSSTWFKETLKDFQRAVNSVNYELKDQVNKLLQYWKKSCNSPSSAKKSQQEFGDHIESYSNEWGALFNLKNKTDKVEFARYLLTGSLPLHPGLF